jgi:hypothetical protein
VRKGAGNGEKVHVAEDEWCRDNQPKKAVDGYEVRRALEENRDHTSVPQPLDHTVQYPRRDTFVDTPAPGMNQDQRALDRNPGPEKTDRSTLDQLVWQRERRRVRCFARLFVDRLKKPIALMCGSDFG